MHDLPPPPVPAVPRRAGLRVIPPVQLPRGAEVLGVHLLRALLHCTALPVARPRHPVARRVPRGAPRAPSSVPITFPIEYR